MSEPEFKSWASIERLRKYTGCVVTEKIDGTNGIVHVAENGTVTAGSRNRWLTLDSDNYGFCRWVTDHADELRQLGPGYHYGEWWGAGIQRRYGVQDKRFSLFNVARWGEGGADADKKPGCCLVVPVLYRGEYSADAVRAVAHELQRTGSVAAPGFMDPEGIVALFAGRLFKYTLDGDGHKSTRAA